LGYEHGAVEKGQSKLGSRKYPYGAQKTLHQDRLEVDYSDFPLFHISLVVSGELVLASQQLAQ